VTVPKPFNFDVRENTRAKSIRERKLDEMVKEKEFKEEMNMKKKFKAKGPPPQVVAPRYDSILEKNE